MEQSARATLRKGGLARISAFAQRRKRWLPYIYELEVTGRATEAERGDVTRRTAAHTADAHVRRTYARRTHDKIGGARSARRLARGSALARCRRCRLLESRAGGATREAAAKSKQPASSKQLASSKVLRISQQQQAAAASSSKQPQAAAASSSKQQQAASSHKQPQAVASSSKQ